MITEWDQRKPKAGGIISSYFVSEAWTCLLNVYSEVWAVRVGYFAAAEGVSVWECGAVRRDLSSLSILGGLLPGRFHMDEVSQPLVPDRVKPPSLLRLAVSCAMRGPGNACKIFFSPSPTRQAQSSCEQSQVYHFLVREQGVPLSTSTSDRRESEKTCSGLHSISALGQGWAWTGILVSVAGSYHPFAHAAARWVFLLK